jgi:hypothetical protein
MTQARAIDVVVPIQDVGAYLEAALDSVLGQTVDPASVVVVDAGSWEPVRLSDSLATRCTLVRCDERLTAGGARNVGASFGTAPYLAFLDADDLWPPDRNERLLAAAEAHDAEWAYGLIESFADQEAASRLGVAATTPGAIAGAGLFARATFEVIGGFDASLTLGEFVDFAARLRARGVRSTTIGDVTLRRRVHLDSTTVKAMRDRSGYLTVVRAHLARSAGAPRTGG